MKKRIRCLWHPEKTASLVRRKNDWYCYGACSRSFSVKDVEEKGVYYDYEEDYDCQEDIEEKLKYIKNLPVQDYRGLRFPTDERGYFIVWHGEDFYKYRRFDDRTGPKYLAPKGHPIPLFWARKAGNQTLVIAEGEINALSIAKAITSWDVCSPGSATKFKEENLLKYLTEFKRYNNIVVILDKDAAGSDALSDVQAFFLYKIPFVKYVQMAKDSNEILCEKGPTGLQEELQRLCG